MPALTLEKLSNIITTSLSIDSTSTGEETEVDQSDQPPVKGMDESLLTDEERILELLAAHDKRLWQSDIVAETGFSESKTSRLLCAMEDEGKVSRARIGRRKVVDLPDSAE